MESKLKIKVCGMRDPENIMQVAALNPDFMGFIFYEQSKRYVGESFKIPDNFPDHIKRVGVFVNEKPDKILKLIDLHQLDFVQLHGDESSFDCELLKIKAKVIKVFHVDDAFDLKSTKKFYSCTDFFMFDTKGIGYGGTGRSFDWSLLKKYEQRHLFFLAGGVSIKNITEVKEYLGTRLFAVDINSGVESEPGMKDINKIISFKKQLSELSVMDNSKI